MAGKKKNFMHPRLMKMDPTYTPCAVVEGDELRNNGIFRFNISRMLEDLESGMLIAQPLRINLLEWYREHSHESVNEDHLASVDLTRPILVAELNEDNFVILDGSHRFEKARRADMEWLDAWQVSGEQLIPYFTTRFGYEKFVEYWNTKLADHVHDREILEKRLERQR